MGFFNDHNHTVYSNLRLVDCINKPKALIDRAIELGLTGLAITDHECLSGHMEINMYAKKLRETHPDFTIALGNEIYLVDSRRSYPYNHFILIAKDALGHQALRRLSSIAWYNSYQEGPMTRVPTTKDELRQIMQDYKGHVIATTACIGGELGHNILDLRIAEQNQMLPMPDNIENIDRYIKYCIDVFGRDDFYIECAPGESEEQIYVNERLKTIAEENNLKMVPGTDSHYLDKSLRFAHKAYLNSKDGEREVDLFYEYAYLMSEDECREHLRKSFDDSWITWMFECSEMMRQSITWYDLSRPQKIPMVDVNPPAPSAWWGVNNPYADDFKEGCYKTLGELFISDNPQERQWVNDVWTALNEKVGPWNEHKDYVARLETEADVIKFIGGRLDTCLFAYFNTFKHYIDLFWDCGSIVGPGRGSATGFLSNYLLGITQLDPIKWDLPWWRFLNKERAELPDIDIDLAPSRRPAIFEAIRAERGELGLVQVATFGTEGSKSAVITACRGYRHTDAEGFEEYPEGIDNDIALYMSSLIPSHRGFTWPLHDVVYGNEQENRNPIPEFINEVNAYPGLLDIMLTIEGVVKQRGIHASGVILYNNDIYDTGAIMRAPSGELITCYDLHMAEAAGDTKYDFLVTEACDKMIMCLNLMKEHGVMENEGLRWLYNKYLHPEVIDTTDQRIWDALAEGSVLDVFQFNSGSGLMIAKKTQPQNPLEMTAANAMMRLMSEPGVESQQDRYVRIRDNGLEVFDREMRAAGLDEKVIQKMHYYCDTYYGCCAIQEQMMQILMDEDIAKFTLKEANDARKIVAKKQMARIPELHEKVNKAIPDPTAANYIWRVAVAPQLGYAFSLNHSLPYSFVGIQMLKLALDWSPVYWNTACLIVNSGAIDPEAGGQTDYGKIAKAVNDLQERGITIRPVNINSSEYGFAPDEKNNAIYFGLKGLLSVGDDVVSSILANRPYASFEDFMQRCPLNKSPMVSLIKAGAFDDFGERRRIMALYLWRKMKKKNEINMRNMAGLIREGLLPTELNDQRKIFEFNRYLKDKCAGDESNFWLDERAIKFLQDHFMIDVGADGEHITLNMKKWDKQYQAEMDVVREWMKSHQEDLIYQLNRQEFMNEWNKYAQGTLSAWEMEVMCFYYHEHELKHINRAKYGIANYFELPDEPRVEKIIRGHVPLYKLTRICGTVIAKNKTKGDVTLLTPEGVVNVWFRKEYFALFDRQISARGADGKKHVIEKSWFQRGSKIMVTGMRRGEEFIPKKYASTPGHQLYKILSIDDNGFVELQDQRAQGEAEESED